VFVVSIIGCKMQGLMKMNVVGISPIGFHKTLLPNESNIPSEHQVSSTTAYTNTNDDFISNNDGIIDIEIDYSCYYRYRRRRITMHLTQSSASS